VNTLQPNVTAGLAILRPRVDLRLSQWAASHFYLSAESSYVEQRWSAYPYQVGILDCIGNDAIEEVVLRKSARVGYTKMLLAAIGYFAEHRRRSQAVWQPTDEDSDEFVKTELEPMLRDVPAVQAVFPGFSQRNKANTLRQKIFLGSILHLRGGKAAKNYRRLSVSVAAIDEVDAFDADVESEGSPVALARKRVEGATFPKLIIGSTPKTKGLSLVEAREGAAIVRLTYRSPCPACGERHALRWGGRDEPYGMKWTDRDPETVRQLCGACGAVYTQAEYLEAYHAGRWEADDGAWLDHGGEFRDADGAVLPPPRSVAFFVWTANSPQTTWSQIVREFLSAKRKAEAGDTSELKAFVNTTLGESWEEGGESVAAAALADRTEPYSLGTVPEGGVVVTMAVDVQHDRLEVLQKAWGAGEESWQVGYEVLDGDPSAPAVWERLRELIVRPLTHEGGAQVRVRACAIDSGGHHTHEVYQFCRRHRGLVPGGVFAVKGHATRGRPVIGPPSYVDINCRGEKTPRGAQLWLVGTDTAKDLIHGRLRVRRPGPGYVHFSDELPDEYYEQLTAEKRITRHVKGRIVLEWTKRPGDRNEALDLEVYALAAAMRLGLNRWRAGRWQQEKARLIVAKPPESAPIPPGIEPEAAKSAPVPRARPRGGFVSRWRQ
jgi:phage terminase large subunit GpA-like protein